MIDKIRRRLRYTRTRWAYRNKARSNYKAVWNTQARSERGAKLGVGGFTSEDEFDETAHRTLAVLEQTVGIHADDVVLEIGAGVGRVGKVVAPRCARWIGADVSSRMLAVLRERLAAQPNVTTVELSGYDLAPIDDDSVDVVYSTVVFMHLDEWDRYSYVREAFRVLKPGGRCYVDNFSLLAPAGWQTFEEHCRIRPADRLPHMSRASTPQELAAYFAHAGFADIEQGEVEIGGFVTTWGVKPGG